MAIILRTTSSLDRLTYSWSAAKCAPVRCGIQKPSASFKHRETSSYCNSKKSSGVSQSSDLLARCHEAAAAVCPLPSRQPVPALELAIQMEILSHATEAHLKTMNEQHAAPLPRSFLAESVDGTVVECCARGCRSLCANVLAEFQASFDRNGEILGTADDDHKALVKAALQAALANAPRDARLLSQCAVLAWKWLGDLDAAQDLFNGALEIAPDDPDIQASHALFLWQCD